MALYGRPAGDRADEAANEAEILSRGREFALAYSISSKLSVFGQ